MEQINSQEYQIGARGFGGHLEFQNFSNKILILIDGRSVYNPLFSGVSYDAQDVLMDDVERIEIISGPGATLWGANAMNGVINIITKSAADTTGALLRVEAGSEEQGVGARHGGRFGDDAAYRVYAKWFDRGESELDAMDFLQLVREKMKLVEMDEALMNRSVNEGFSGGEKKRNEILQMAVLEPRLAVLDETDSGLDIDALRIVAHGVNSLRGPDRSALVITHYQRLLDHIVPDRVHVLAGGRIVRSGGKELALELEDKGYGWLEPAEARG